MDQRLDILTLRVEDLAATTRFYVEGLGWQPLLAVPGEVTFFQIAPGVLLSLFDARGYDTDAGQVLRAPAVLAQIVEDEAGVHRVVDELVGSGGTLILGPTRADWGGYHAFVEDPTGFCWEVAHNPGWHVDDDGVVTLGPVG